MGKKRKFPTGKLMIKVQSALLGTEQAYDDIFLATGIPANWLWRFAHGRIPDPGVNRVETLFRHLFNRDLVL